MKHYLIGALMGLMLLQPALGEENANTAAPANNNPPQPIAKAQEKTTAPKEQPLSLESSYKREFAFLQNQKSELKNRLHTYKTQAESAEKSISQKIAALEQSNVALAAKEDAVREELTKAEHASEAIDDNSELLDMTYSQGNASLAGYQRSLEKNAEFVHAAQEQKLTMLFQQGIELINELAGINIRDGSFFLNDGVETQGKIITMGNIAAYGTSEKGSGALVPAGDGRFKLWSEPSADSAEAVAAGKINGLLKIFLFENRDKAIDEKQEKTVLSVIQSGGEIGWVIVALGCVALLLVIARGVLLFIASKKSQLIAGRVIPLLLEDQESEALDFCQVHKGPFARVLTTIMRNSHGNRDHMDDVISEALLHESGGLNRFGSAILVIASVSPLLGLLGTVTGMISTFDIITEFGTGDPKLLSSGISIALVTTELGLIVAIPSVLAGTLLGSWAEAIKYDLEEVALRTSNILLDRDSPLRNDHSKAKKPAPVPPHLEGNLEADAYAVS